MTRSRTTVLTALAAFTLAAGQALAASPSLSIILPRGVQRGAEHELTFSGRNLADAEEILYYTPGVETLEITSDNQNRIKVKVRVAEDAPLGEHVAQVRCKSGISDYRTFYVGALPAVDEKEPNSEFESPQPVSLGVTVQGTVSNEDVDYFVVDAKKGERIVAEVEAIRLGTYLFDPYVAILDADRFELAASDDSPLLYQDCVASIVAPEDGRYFVEIRESAYGGNGNCRYRAHVGSFPRPKAVYPAGGKLGEQVEVRYLGDPAGDVTAKIQLPAKPEEDFGLHATDAGGIAPSANPFRLFPHGNSLEAEPNDDREHASAAELPNAFNGIIQNADDQDWFAFEAKKGQSFEVECYARRVRSPLDAVMAVYDANGKRLAADDDDRRPDSHFRFNVPADGRYFLQVRDHLNNGGPTYVYRVEFQPVEPSLSLSIPRVRRYSQDRQTIVVPQGNRFGTLMNARRRGFRGQLVLDPKNLPEGITVHADPMPDYQNSMPIVFEAAPDAPIAGKLVDFTAKLDDPNRDVRGGFTNTADLVRGRPGQSIYWSRRVNRLAIAVVEEVPFELEIVEPKVPIVQNGSMQLKVVAHRQEGFDKPIKVQFPFRPPGIGASSSVTIPEGKNEVLYPISANGNARVGEYRVYVLGEADVNGNAYVASQLAPFEVVAPYLQLAIERTACEQGQDVEVFCKVTPQTPFEGEAVAKLVGLPNKTTTEEVRFTKDTAEFSFKVETEPDSPEGRHKNLFCQVVVTQNGEPITHRAGSGELRIDKPLPKEEPKKAEPEKVAEKKPEEPKPPMEKRLTRLEKLRLEAKKRLEEARANN